MRHYFIDEAGERLHTDIIEQTKSDAGTYYFRFQDETELYVRHLGVRTFVSTDGSKWEVMPVGQYTQRLEYLEKTFRHYRGFIPSGAEDQGNGGLMTSMPGKVIKIMVCWA